MFFCRKMWKIKKLKFINFCKIKNFKNLAKQKRKTLDLMKNLIKNNFKSK